MRQDIWMIMVTMAILIPVAVIVVWVFNILSELAWRKYAISLFSFIFWIATLFFLWAYLAWT